MVNPNQRFNFGLINLTFAILDKQELILNLTANFFLFFFAVNRQGKQ